MKSIKDINIIMDMVDILYALDLCKTRFPEDASIYHYHTVMKYT
jgi:hypothetical protein